MEILNVDAEGKPLGKAKPKTLWVRGAPLEKLEILKNDFGGTWDRMVEILCEQMMASGLVSEKGRKEFREVSNRSGTELLDDQGWRTTYRIGASWSEVAATQRKIAEELAKLRGSVEELIETVEDHATAMAEVEAVRTDTEKSWDSRKSTKSGWRKLLDESRFPTLRCF